MFKALMNYGFGPPATNKQNTTPPATLLQEEQDRATYLQDAQDKAFALFKEIERDLVRPGITESQLSKEIWERGEKLGVRTYWHKRVARSGPNTLLPYKENAPDRIIEDDDILFVDLGPVFEAWEADFGRTFVLGKDPAKLKLRDDLEPVWKSVKSRFDEDQDMTGDELYDIACKTAQEYGWEFGGKHSGHLVGDLPHEVIPRDKISLYITTGSTGRMRSVGKNGHLRHWILEIHLVDGGKQIGGFMEQLLTVD